MDNPDLPLGHSPGHSHNASSAQTSSKSRLEKVLGKGSLWKKQALHKISRARESERIEREDRARETDKMAHMLARLSIQLDERDDEIARLQHALSALKSEKSQLDLAHREAVELHRAELKQLQVAYDQFEKESDGLLAELGEQNERLLNECRYQNGRSLLKT